MVRAKADPNRTQLAIDLPNEAFLVLDGYCNGQGISRTAGIQQILNEWSQKQLHVATVICRTTGVNPFAPVPGLHRDR